MTGVDNAAVIRELAAAYAVADITAIDRLLDDDVVFHIPGKHPLSGTYSGKAEVFATSVRSPPRARATTVASTCTR